MDSAIHREAQRVWGDRGAAVAILGADLGRCHVQVEVGVEAVGIGVGVGGVAVGGVEVIHNQLAAAAGRTVDAVGLPDHLVALLVGGHAVAAAFDGRVADEDVLQLHRNPFVAPVFPAPAAGRAGAGIGAAAANAEGAGAAGIQRQGGTLLEALEH
ncbi:hypothetical protein D3C76_1360240 [compost metagenome]